MSFANSSLLLSCKLFFFFSIKRQINCEIHTREVHFLLTHLIFLHDSNILSLYVLFDLFLYFKASFSATFLLERNKYPNLSITQNLYIFAIVYDGTVIFLGYSEVSKNLCICLKRLFDFSRFRGTQIWPFYFRIFVECRR